jgi:hypothetical protein
MSLGPDIAWLTSNAVPEPGALLFSLRIISRISNRAFVGLPMSRQFENFKSSYDVERVHRLQRAIY